MNHAQSLQFPINTQPILTSPDYIINNEKNIFTIDTNTLFCYKMYSKQSFIKISNEDKQTVIPDV